MVSKKTSVVIELNFWSHVFDNNMRSDAVLIFH